MEQVSCVHCGDKHYCPPAYQGPANWKITAGFIQACCIIEESRSIRSTNLYDTYRLWALRNDHPIISFSLFSRGMKHNGHKTVKASVMWYHGISLTPEVYASTWPKGFN